VPEFVATVQTLRVGTLTIRLEAATAEDARALLESECDAGLCHCPPELCTDDVVSTLQDLREERRALGRGQASLFDAGDIACSH
jgi:hypothetical protein